MKHHIKTLKNGARVLMIPSESTTVTVLVLVGTGSSYESAQENGLSHFLEHMCFKGTEKYPTAKSISETIESLGAVTNAFTSHEYTGYYIKGNPEHIQTYLSVLGDIYIHSTFPEIEIEKEKGVIIEEIRMYDDRLNYKVAEELMNLMYQDQPVGRPVAGTIETVMSFSRSNFLNYRKKHYHGSNTVIALCGAVSPKITKEVQKAFAGIETKKPVQKKKVKTTQKETAARIIYKAIDQGHLAIGFHSVPYRHEDAPAIQLLATILGKGQSSRLFHLLREELGVAYSVHVDQDPFLDHGIFGVSAGVDKSRMNEVLTLIGRELQQLKEILVDESELDRAKEYSLGMLRLGLETSDDFANFYGTQLVLQKPIKQPKDIIKEYRNVTREDVRRVAKKLFVGKKGNIAIIGPYTQADIEIRPLAGL